MPKPLTPLAIEKLKPGKLRREIADAAFPGLSIVVHPSGQKTWTYRYRYARRLRRITIGNWPAVDLAKARRRAETALAAREKGIDPTVALFAPKSSQHISRADRDSFGVLIRVFMTKHAIPNTKSWRETARLLGLRVEEQKGKKAPTFTDVKDGIVERWAERPVASIARADIREMIDRGLERGATTTVNREVAAVRGFLGWCVTNDIIEVNVATGMRAVPENKRTRILSDKELRVIWLAAESEGYPFGDIVRLLMLTGQRRGEVAGTSWTEFDLKARMWAIPEERTKNGLPHLVPLSDAAIDILSTIPRFAGGDFVFGLGGRNGFTGYSKAKRSLDETIYKLLEDELPEWNLHDLRRTVATGMARLGVLPHVVEAVLNHISGSKAGVAGIYNTWSYEAEKRDALTRWADHVLKISNPDADEG